MGISLQTQLHPLLQGAWAAVMDSQRNVLVSGHLLLSLTDESELDLTLTGQSPDSHDIFDSISLQFFAELRSTF